MNQGALATVDMQAIIERIANGEYAAHIASELGVTKQALNLHLKKIKNYQESREIGMEVRLDDGLMRIDQSDSLDLARMEEIKLRRLEWRAEREFPHRWGQKVEHSGNQVIVHVGLKRNGAAHTEQQPALNDDGAIDGESKRE